MEKFEKIVNSHIESINEVLKSIDEAFKSVSNPETERSKELNTSSRLLEAYRLSIEYDKFAFGKQILQVILETMGREDEVEETQTEESTETEVVDTEDK